MNVVTYRGHKNFVSCVCWLPPCEAYPEGLVITGSNDNTILGYTLHDGMVQITLESHENAVCSVTPGRDSGVLVRLVSKQSIMEMYRLVLFCEHFMDDTKWYQSVSIN